MKKIAYLVLLVFLTSALAKSQVFVGGSFGFNSSGGSTDDAGTVTDKDRSTSFSFRPKAGIVASEDILVGAEAFIGITRVKAAGDIEDLDITTALGLNPFARYYAFRLNKFSLFGQAEIGLGFSKSKNIYDGETTDGPKTTNFGFSIFPGIAYDLTEKLQLEAYINGFNFGVSYSVEKEEIDGEEYIDKTTNFGFGATMDNIVTSGNIVIGAIYKF